MIVRTFLLCLVCLQAAAQENTSDGPYVFYHDGWVVVKRVRDRVCLTDSFREADKKKHPVAISFSDHPAWNFSVPFHSFRNEAVEFKRPEKVFVCSDIEGEFAAFRSLLNGNHIINEKYEWTFGDGALIIAGDLFDRGREVPAFLWLLYKLEAEARKKGGYVHVILGNHDIMNLSGDYRYVDPKYFENAGVMNVKYAALYAENTELGRWLRSKNIIEKTGDLLVLHGGISPEVNAAQTNITDMNTRCRPYYDKKFNLIPKDLQVFFGKDAPFWYRGYFLDPKATNAELDSTLSFYHVKHIIVGHDITDHVVSLYGNKVIGVDVDEHAGHTEGLLIKKNHFYRTGSNGREVLLSR